MPYIGAGIQRFNTADGLTVNGNAEVTGTTALTGNATAAGTLDVTGTLTAGTTNLDGAVTINESGAAVDFRVESDTQTHALFVDASNNSVHIGDSTDYGGKLNIVTGGNNPQLVLVSTDADSSVGPEIELFRNSASPASSDTLGQLQFKGQNNAAETLSYAEIDTRISDVSDGTEDGEMRLQVKRDGTTRTALSLGPTETVFNDAGIDNNFRIESDSSAHAFFLNANANRVQINSGSAPNESCQFYVNDVVLIGGTNSVSGGFPTSGLGIITTQGSHCAVFYDDNDLANPRFNFARNGNLTVSGALSKGSGSFRIDHPLPAKNSTHDLVHSFIEGPQADLIYRGKVDLVAGSATVNIDTAAGMTDGTFVLLCGDVQCFTSNEDGFTAVKGSVSGNTLTITAEADTCTDTISWMVVGERKDQHMIDTTWTDDSGKVIVEPLKGSQEVSEEE